MSSLFWNYNPIAITYYGLSSLGSIFSNSKLNIKKVDKLDDYNFDSDYLNRLEISLKEKHGDKYEEKLTTKKIDIASNILFSDIERICENKKKGIRAITNWFSPIKK